MSLLFYGAVLACAAFGAAALAALIAKVLTPYLPETLADWIFDL